MPSRKSFLRLETSTDGTLSVAAIQAEVAKRSRGWSAFAPRLSTFALRSFSSALEAEEISAPADAISHASSQVAVRTSLVQAMTSEVRRDLDAALTFARREAAAHSRPATAAPVARTMGGAPHVTDDADDVQSARAVLLKWTAACESVMRLVKQAEAAEGDGRGETGSGSSSSQARGEARAGGGGVCQLDDPPNTRLDGRINLRLERIAAWAERPGRRPGAKRRATVPLPPPSSAAGVEMLSRWERLSSALQNADAVSAEDGGKPSDAASWSIWPHLEDCASAARAAELRRLFDVLPLEPVTLTALSQMPLSGGTASRLTTSVPFTASETEHTAAAPSTQSPDPAGQLPSALTGGSATASTLPPGQLGVPLSDSQVPLAAPIPTPSVKPSPHSARGYQGTDLVDGEGSERSVGGLANYGEDGPELSDEGGQHNPLDWPTTTAPPTKKKRRLAVIDDSESENEDELRTGQRVQGASPQPAALTALQLKGSAEGQTARLVPLQVGGGQPVSPQGLAPSSCASAKAPPEPSPSPVDAQASPPPPWATELYDNELPDDLLASVVDASTVMGASSASLWPVHAVGSWTSHPEGDSSEQLAEECVLADQALEEPRSHCIGEGASEGFTASLSPGAMEILVPLDPMWLRSSACDPSPTTVVDKAGSTPKASRPFKLRNDAEVLLRPMMEVEPEPTPLFGLISTPKDLRFVLPPSAIDTNAGAAMFRRLLSVDADCDEWYTKHLRSCWAPTPQTQPCGSQYYTTATQQESTPRPAPPLLPADGTEEFAHDDETLDNATTYGWEQEDGEFGEKLELPVELPEQEGVRMSGQEGGQLAEEQQRHDGALQNDGARDDAARLDSGVDSVASHRADLLWEGGGCDDGDVCIASVDGFATEHHSTSASCNTAIDGVRMGTEAVRTSLPASMLGSHEPGNMPTPLTRRSTMGTIGQWVAQEVCRAGGSTLLSTLVGGAAAGVDPPSSERVFLSVLWAATQQNQRQSGRGKQESNAPSPPTTASPPLFGTRGEVLLETVGEAADLRIELLLTV